MKTDKERLWLRLQTIGGIGSDPKGGISRFAWTPEYRKACLELISLAEQYGISTRMDTVGNLYFRLEGRCPGLPAVLTGSHLDTVPCGGRFDGLAGIMTGLEVLFTMKEHEVIPKRSIEVVAFVNEEATQFLGGTFGSKAVCGVLPFDYSDTCRNRHTGKLLREAMTEFSMGLDPDNIEGSKIDPQQYLCFIELHIEQGRHLLDEGCPLAVVTDIAGIRQLYVKLRGESCHAGGMAMKNRHDTLMAAARIVCEAERLSEESGGKDTRATVGYIKSYPAEHNIVAEESEIPIDYREDDDVIWSEYYNRLETFIQKECERRGLEYTIIKTLELEPAHADKSIIRIIGESAASHGIQYTKMVSYPCHDAVNMERIMPMGMIFLRSSNGGLSHCPQEYTTPEDLEAGANVLLDTLLRLAECEKL